jgi:virginiamycin A acetyltransferase
VVLRTGIKVLLQGVFLALAFPLALLSAFGRVELVYNCFAQLCALIPGIVGDYWRVAYYKLTLVECAIESRIQFGSYFVYRNTKVGRGVYIGSYCVLGHTSIGDRTQIASGVQVLSGHQQHRRAASGQILSSASGVFRHVNIGADCWIGAGAILMADVGEGSTIGAGSIVTKPVPERSIAVGNPARVIRSVSPEAQADPAS